MDQLERQYLQGAADKGDVCPNAFINNADPSASGGGDLKQIQLSEVAGLWILLGGAAALAIPLTLYQRWSFKKGGATLRVYDSFLRRSVVGVLEGDSFKKVEEVAPQVGSAPSFSMDTSGLAKNSLSPRRVLDHKPSKLGDAQAAKLMVIAEADNHSEAGSEENETVSDPRGAEIVSDPRGAAQLKSDGGGKEAAQSQQHRKSQETDLNQVLELTSIDGDKPS